MRKKSNITTILSNPCFEVFYLYHYEKKLPPMKKPCDVKEYLSKYIDEYKESNDYWQILFEHQKKALERVRGTNLSDIPLNLDNSVAMTNIWVIFEDLLKLGKKD